MRYPSLCSWLAVACWVCPSLASTSLAAGSDGPDPSVLTAKIDQHLASRWATLGVEPAPLADDAEWMRRLYLDLTGKIPTVSQARAYLDDPAPDKRQRLVEHLLASPAYVTHFANVWRALLIPEASANPQLRFLVPGFEGWLRKQLAENHGYDQFVRNLLSAPVATRAGNRRQMMTLPDLDGLSPLGFFVAKEVKPENLAAVTARLFLGVRLECAQCHDHPHASWKREQFWNLAAFFAGLQGSANPAGGTVREINDRREIQIPGKEQVVPALFLDGREPQWEYKVPGRVTLARWITAPDNPYFARAVVNRLWAYFLGTGLVEPVDDFGPDHPPSHPELLDELARQFVAAQFDVKFLIRALTASRAYQLSSTQTSAGQQDPRLFAKMAVRGLSPEQIYDSFVVATGLKEPLSPSQPDPGMSGWRAEFLNRFAAQEARTEWHTSILQALFLMNGEVIDLVTDPKRGELLVAVAEAPFLSPAQQVETLFLAVLSRRPRPDEADKVLKYVADGGPKKDSKTALGDVLWALLNSPEFLLNH